MHRAPLSILMLLGALAGATGGAGAQDVLADRSGADREDSIRALRSARSRQAAFERLRRANLSETWGGGGGQCDERIGRFCLTYSDDDLPEWEPPEEPETVVLGRGRLLDELAASSAVIPGDAWVVGQQVRYLVEARRFDDAAAAARRCRSERWWCEALAGFVAHQSGDAVAADAAFERMLTAMPAETRRDWTDLDLILDGASRRHYRRLEPEARASYEERFWDLADPLAGTGGSDTRSEHFSRHLLARLQERAETAEDLAWGDDLKEILIRFGFPAGWERIRDAYPPMLGERASLISHYPESDIDLVPPPALLADSFAPAGVEWEDERRRARASYPLPRRGERLRWFGELEHQIAIFRDGDSATIVAAWQLPEDSVAADAEVEAALAIWQGDQPAKIAARRVTSGPAGALQGTTAAMPTLISIETHLPGRNRAARVRSGVSLAPIEPGTLVLSDLLLFRPLEAGVPEDRAAAVARARGSTRARAGERIGVYWELYGMGEAPSMELEISLRLVRTEVGLLRRLGQRLGVVSEVQPIRLRWAEGSGEAGTLGRALELEIPLSLAAGEYAVELTITAPERGPLLARRALHVLP